jgi:membrane associated rhomboid family serine protease
MSELTPQHCYRHPGRETYVSCQRCERPICPDCMIPSSVGHQCPECVKSGMVSTRQAALPYGGTRVANPLIESVVLIGINVAVWLAIMSTGGNSSPMLNWMPLLPETWGFQDADGQVILLQGVNNGAVWQVVTAVFTHVAIMHIGLNMLSLFFLGPPVTAILGRARFLAVYALSGLAGSVTVLYLSNPHGQTLGASGAIFGLMGAFLVIARKLQGNVSQILFWLGLNLVFTFTASGISWQGHIGGLVGGALTTAILVAVPRGPKRSLIQWSALGFLAVVLVVLVLVKVQSWGMPVPY